MLLLLGEQAKVHSFVGMEWCAVQRCNLSWVWGTVLCNM